MPKQNSFRTDTFADLWAKADYIKRLVDLGAEKNHIDPETAKAVNGVVGDLYRAMEKGFGDNRVKLIVEYGFKEPARILS